MVALVFIRPRSLAINRLYLRSVQTSPVKILKRLNHASGRSPKGSGEIPGEFGASALYCSRMIKVSGEADFASGSLKRVTPIMENEYIKMMKNKALLINAENDPTRTETISRISLDVLSSLKP